MPESMNELETRLGAVLTWYLSQGGSLSEVMEGMVGLAARLAISRGEGQKEFNRISQSISQGIWETAAKWEKAFVPGVRIVRGNQGGIITREKEGKVWVKFDGSEAEKTFLKSGMAAFIRPEKI